nr:MAG TPA: hypothetical protein [Caudoviricetes sp.]
MGSKIELSIDFQPYHAYADLIALPYLAELQMLLLPKQ